MTVEEFFDKKNLKVSYIKKYDYLNYGLDI